MLQSLVESSYKLVKKQDYHPDRKMDNGHEQVIQKIKTITDVGKDAQPH